MCKMHDLQHEGRGLNLASTTVGVVPESSGGTRCGEMDAICRPHGSKGQGCKEKAGQVANLKILLKSKLFLPIIMIIIDRN